MSQDFIDEARIFVQSGKGGDGMITFRREKFVPRGGPSGGDGGKGGNVIFIGNPKLNTLRNFRHQAHYRADDGGRGGSSNRTGANGGDLVLEVPLGTLIRDDETGRVIADVNQAEQRVVIAQGGRGGRGNTHWKSSRNQAPNVAEKGDQGEARWLRLELKVLADVGIVGMPNAGKSTLLSVISNAKPKIADYPFTTLVPNLGVVTQGYEDIVAADIPGLVEGAAQGLGLGHDFLKHVQRTRLLLHLVDGSASNPEADFNQINTELTLFDERLGERPQLVVITKLDLPESQERAPALQAAFEKLGYPVMAISAATQQNTKELVGRMFEMVAAMPDEPVSILTEDEMPLYVAPTDPNSFKVQKLEDGIFEVKGESIERAVARTLWYSDEAVQRFQKILEVIGITAALQKEGVKVGDTVIIGEQELEWGE